MKFFAIVFPLLLSALTISKFTSSSGQPEDPIDLRDLSQYVRVTEQPFEMDDATAQLCQPVDWEEVNPHEPLYPQKAFCNVYVSPSAKEIMLSGKGTYPEGSLVIKSKLATAEAKTPELFTVMQKMPAGYDEEHGDWKYFVVDGSTFKLLAAGRIDSCKSCHDQYAESDYVTRLYLKQKNPSK
ncbi:MAG: cytochrome P460 family protein [Planctomycetota bacterium]